MKRKGFTLMEIMVVLIIIGILAAVAFPSYNTYMQQNAAKGAYNNLLAIYHAQNNYYLKTGAYYISPSETQDLNGINSALSLNLFNDQFSYYCLTESAWGYQTQSWARSSGYLCRAQTVTSPLWYLYVNDGPLVAASNPGCINPPGQSYCPS